ncbi:MAG: hypothetical protein JWR00_3588, partial [Rubritepida sp.]|nr:hypothetical protein [Rubritepida sp.]
MPALPDARRRITPGLPACFAAGTAQAWQPDRPVRTPRALDAPTGLELGLPDTVAYGWQGLSV